VCSIIFARERGEAVSASITIRTGPSLIVSRADCPRGFVEIEAMCDGLRAACCSVLPALAARFSPEAFRLEAETQNSPFQAGFRPERYSGAASNRAYSSSTAFLVSVVARPLTILQG
jgi:hypothetical protein